MNETDHCPSTSMALMSDIQEDSLSLLAKPWQQSPLLSFEPVTSLKTVGSAILHGPTQFCFFGCSFLSTIHSMNFTFNSQFLYMAMCSFSHYCSQ